MIEVFGFNAVNGKMFELHNTTVEEIKSALKKQFPKWSDEVVEKIATNQNFYKPVIPYVPKQKPRKVKVGSIAKETLNIKGFELNPIFNLGQSIHAYKKIAYRCWGTITANILDDATVAQKYDSFESSYNAVVEAVKSTPRATKQSITKKVIDMCDKMDALKAAVERTGYLTKDADKEYVNGNGRRIGMGELMKLVGELTSECSTALK